MKKAKKRHVQNHADSDGIMESLDSNYVCPICLDIIQEAYMTKCGHSFCAECIIQSLQEHKACPRCGQTLDGKDQIFPNFCLNELLLRYRQQTLENKRSKLGDESALNTELRTILSDPEKIGVQKLEEIISSLQEKKSVLEYQTRSIYRHLTQHFLSLLLKRKQTQMDQVVKEVDLIKSDLAELARDAGDNDAAHSSRLSENLDGDAVSLVNETGDGGVLSEKLQDGFNGSRFIGSATMDSNLCTRRKRIHQHFNDLEEIYLSHRQDEVTKSVFESTLQNEDNNYKRSSSIHSFAEKLEKFACFSACRPLATLNYAADLYNTSSIVSSIEFDLDSEYFAIAGVTKKIKIYEYDTVIRNVVDLHYPVNEMTGNSKISSVVWSSYHKSLMASSDYEGSVILWDAFTGVQKRSYQEHEKRCWSLDFNHMDPKVLASGSDDSKVKLWCTSSDHSFANIEAKANVCCVKFSPKSRFHLAFGSADHCIHYYDLRKLSRALTVFKGHKKAVSYTKFANADELISASTDSQLKLWDAHSGSCLTTYKGHVNDKNFVGLATDGEYIACGSENNALYVYYKGLTKHLLSFKFDNTKGILDHHRSDEEATEFVSAVSWRASSNVIVAANSLGVIKVLELV